MKLSAINYLSKAPNKINTAKSNPIKNTVNNTEIAKNSLSEAIGRSSVMSFKGTYRMNDSVFEYKNQSAFGDKEKTLYNKENGSLIHTVTGYDGKLKAKIEYHPQEGTEIVTTTEKDGSRKVRTKKPNYSSVEIFDAQERQTFFQEQDEVSQRTIETDFARKRRVTEYLYKNQRSVEVYDLKKECPVVSGPLVIDRVYDKTSGVYVTKNIITENVLKEEKYNNRDELEYSIDYYPETTTISKKYFYNSQTGGYDEYKYDKNGAKTSYTKISKNGRNKIVNEYTNNGKTVVSTTAYVLNKKDEIETIVDYIPGTNIIERETQYDDNSYNIYFYSKEPNVITHSEYYVDETLKESVKYKNRGEVVVSVIQYNDDNSQTETTYASNSKKAHKKHTLEDGFVDWVRSYSIKTGKLKRIVFYSRNGESKEVFFNPFGVLEKEEYRNPDSTLKKIIGFYEDGKTTSYVCDYNLDGSYKKIEYDEDGYVTAENYFDRNNNKRDEKTRKQDDHWYDYFHSTDFFKTDAPPPAQTSDEDFIAEINHKFGYGDDPDYGISTVTKEEWKRLAKFLDLSVEETKHLNTKTYRKLANKFHPDHMEEAKKQLAENIINILTAIHNMEKKRASN